MLELEEVHYHPVTAAKPVLKGVNLVAQLSHPVIVGGASGSGKTSLIEVISGLSKPLKGTLRWNNQKLSERQRRHLCGIVFQFPERHFLGLNIGNELRFGHRRLTTEEQINSLEKVGLSKINLKQAPEKLSGGQQRRLAIAVQLLRKPRVLLLDEPTAGLDWSVRDEVLEVLQKLTKEMLLIIVTHEPELFELPSIRKYQLVGGQLIK